jgi:hypothetical protein
MDVEYTNLVDFFSDPSWDGAANTHGCNDEFESNFDKFY